MRNKVIKDSEGTQQEVQSKGNWITQVLLIIILIIVLLMLLMKSKGVTVQDVANYATSDLGDLSSAEAVSSNVVFSGISPYYVKAGGYLPLQNDKNNVVNLKYVLTDEAGKVVYESKVIKPGSEDRFILDKTYVAGEYTFHVAANKITKDGTLGIGVTSDMVVIVQ